MLIRKSDWLIPNVFACLLENEYQKGSQYKFIELISVIAETLFDILIFNFSFQVYILYVRHVLPTLFFPNLPLVILSLSYQYHLFL